jgi:hypothetical protein
MWYRANFNGRPPTPVTRAPTHPLDQTRHGIIPIGSSAANVGRPRQHGFGVRSIRRAPTNSAREPLVNRLANGRRALRNGFPDGPLAPAPAGPDPDCPCRRPHARFAQHRTGMGPGVTTTRGWKQHKVRDAPPPPPTSAIGRSRSSWTLPAPVEHLYRTLLFLLPRPDVILLFPKRYARSPPRPVSKLDGSPTWSLPQRDGLPTAVTEAFLRPLDEHSWHERAIEAGPTLVPTVRAKCRCTTEHYRTPLVQIRRGCCRGRFVSLGSSRRRHRGPGPFASPDRDSF